MPSHVSVVCHGVSVLSPPCPLPWANFLPAHLAVRVPSPEQKAQLLPWVPETAQVLGRKSSLSLLGGQGDLWANVAVVRCEWKGCGVTNV